MAISTNLSEFVSQLAAFNKKHVGAATQRMRGMARYALKQAVFYTPIDTGHLVASWRLGVNNIDTSVSATGRRAAAGAVAEGLSTISRADVAKLGDTLYISNEVRYAEYVENGSPTTRPSRMISRTLRDIYARYGT